jgi:hypothetical protein
MFFSFPFYAMVVKISLPERFYNPKGGQEHITDHVMKTAPAVITCHGTILSYFEMTYIFFYGF